MSSPAEESGPPTIALIALGGTIAMRPDSAGGVTPGLGAADLLPARGLGAIGLRSVEFRRVASSHLTLADIQDLAAAIAAEFAAGTAGVVVTQGTDTIEETAFALDLMLPAGAPVVVTGAMRHSAMPGADGPANVAAAIAVASDPAMRGVGVLVVMNDEIHAARFVRKGRTGNPASFVSPACGPLGWVEEGRARLLTRPAAACPHLPPFGRDAPRVLLLPTMTDGGETLLDAAARPEIAGVVVAGMGGGHAPPALIDGLKALARAKPVILSSRTGAGEIFQSTYGYPGGEIDLIAAGLIPGGWLDPLKARILLIGLLAAGRGRAEIAAAFDWR
jgi:L-asparaginase